MVAVGADSPSVAVRASCACVACVAVIGRVPGVAGSGVIAYGVCGVRALRVAV